MDIGSNVLVSLKVHEIIMRDSGTYLKLTACDDAFPLNYVIVKKEEVIDGGVELNQRKTRP